MSDTIYDTHVAFYIDFVDQALASQDSLWHLLLYQSAFSCIISTIVIRRMEHRISPWHVLPAWHRT